MDDELKSRPRILVCKLELVPGTMETLDASDFDVHVGGAEITPTLEVTYTVQTAVASTVGRHNIECTVHIATACTSPMPRGSCM